MTTRRPHPESVRIEALTRMTAGESAYAVSRAMGIPQPTLALWRRDMRAGDGAVASTRNAVATVRPEEMWATVQRAATDRLLALVPTAEVGQLRDIAVTAGIAADKYMDYTQGRKGTSVNVDNRQQTIALPEGTTLDDLRRFAALDS